MRKLVPFLCLGLAACGTAQAVPTIPGKITPPSRELMKPPAALADLPEGASIYDDAAKCRAEYGRVSSQVTGLQSWSAVVTRRRGN
jgi:hypothetical protein